MAIHKWGIDIPGPFPLCSGRIKFLIVAIRLLHANGMETKSVATITGSVKRFSGITVSAVLDYLGEYVGQRKTIRDNLQNTGCSRLSITQRFASVKHPQTNGLVERANRSLGEGIKARLDRHKGRPGDFVYRANDASHAEDHRKAGTKGEGPYEDYGSTGNERISLRDMDGR
ncbi:reverse transcriptase domain-containing protein [Tanacetum coccineum]